MFASESYKITDEEVLVLYALIFRVYVEKLSFFIDSIRIVYSFLDQAAILTIFANNLMAFVVRCCAPYRQNSRSCTLLKIFYHVFVLSYSCHTYCKCPCFQINVTLDQ
jgi:hypothetical protein